LAGFILVYILRRKRRFNEMSKIFFTCALSLLTPHERKDSHSIFKLQDFLFLKYTQNGYIATALVKNENTFSLFTRLWL